MKIPFNNNALNEFHTARQITILFSGLLVGITLLATSQVFGRGGGGHGGGGRDCDLELKQLEDVHWNAGGNGRYNVFDVTRYTQTERFEVKNDDDDGCNMFVGISGGRSWYSGKRHMSRYGRYLSYQIYDTTALSNVLKDVPYANSNEVLSGTFSDNDEDARISLNYVVTIDPLQIVPPGTYRDRVEVTAYSGSVQNYDDHDDKYVDIEAQIPSTIELSLVDSGNPFDANFTSRVLDFGTFEEGEQLGFDIRVRSNQSYKVEIDSVNNGKMQLQGTTEDFEIPYTLTIGGATVDLRGSPIVARGWGTTDVDGDRHNAVVTVGSVDVGLAGTYRDLLVISIINSH